MANEVTYPVAMPGFEGNIIYLDNEFTWDKESSKWVLVTNNQ
jgi:hypothetical protein